MTLYYATFQPPDGKRMAAFVSDTTDEKQKPPTHLTFLLNFFDELQRGSELVHQLRGNKSRHECRLSRLDSPRHIRTRFFRSAGSTATGWTAP